MNNGVSTIGNNSLVPCLYGKRGSFLKKQINFNCTINPLGYGVVSYNIYKELSQILDITLWLVGKRVDSPTRAGEALASQIKADLAKQEDFNPDLPSLKIWHENQLAERVGRGKYFAYPFFEVNSFDKRRVSHLSSVDHILVASKWAKGIVEREVRDAVVDIVPCGVDTDIFFPAPNPTDKCVFLNCGKWEYRKGHDVLYKAFKAAFSNNEDVELWMMCDNPFLSPQETSDWQSLYKASNIKMLPRVQYQEEVAEIMKNTYCGVFPSRAEGWNLEALEMLAMGKKLIITNYSAHTEFCTDDNSYLLNIKEEEPAYDGKWFKGTENGVWADLESEAYDQLVEHFRQVYKEWGEDPQKSNSQGIDTALDFSWSKSANKINTIIFGE